MWICIKRGLNEGHPYHLRQSVTNFSHATRGIEGISNDSFDFLRASNMHGTSGPITHGVCFLSVESESCQQDHHYHGNRSSWSHCRPYLILLYVLCLLQNQHGIKNSYHYVFGVHVVFIRMFHLSPNSRNSTTTSRSRRLQLHTYSFCYVRARDGHRVYVSGFIITNTVLSPREVGVLFVCTFVDEMPPWSHRQQLVGLLLRGNHLDLNGLVVALFTTNPSRLLSISSNCGTRYSTILDTMAMYRTVQRNRCLFVIVSHGKILIVAGGHEDSG